MTLLPKLFLTLMITLASMAHPDTGETQKVKVLVELFTSQGCSSCPPADRVLNQLQKQQPVDGVEIVALSWHVDYWNRLGWEDPYSSKLYSDRQRSYAKVYESERIYTPQMIIDGTNEFVGSDKNRALTGLKRAGKQEKFDFILRASLDPSGEKGKLEIQDLPEEYSGFLYIAIAEDNLQNDVRSGENSGKHLEHVAVVRHYQWLEVSANVGYRFDLNPEWNRESLKAVVWLQNGDTASVEALETVPLLPTSED